MSVGTRRFAAAQRTAALTRRRRARRLASWVLIVPTLALFSFSVVAGAAGFAGKPDYEAAVRKVAPSGQSTAKGVPVVVDTDNKNNPLAQLLSSTRAVCWITQSQLTRVAKVYRTGRLSVGRFDLVTVYGASDRDLRGLLGAPAVSCTLVRVSTTFFLPFDAHGS